MKKTHCFLLVAILALVLGACDTDEDKDVEANDEQDVDVSDTDENDTDDGTDDGTDTDTGGDFESCIASLKDCNFDDLETPCGSISTIPIPLTGGGTYGPYVIEAGPYGSYVEWNEGEDTEFVNPVNNSEPGCDTFGVLVFGEPPSVNREMLNLRGMKFRLYTIFRPACMKEGEKYPVITWANGTCGQSGGYAALLTTVASHGYVVIASNSRWTDSAPTDNVQLRTLDYAKTLNEDPDSIYYQRLDMDNIGASGHSQGSMATIH
ncbi:MAG: hypothetical protein GY847_08215, partial [Proteobacteria bacterium]|nr:hypothetical protein [Pseudomonadota bacterium]